MQCEAVSSLKDGTQIDLGFKNPYSGHVNHQNNILHAISQLPADIHLDGISDVLDILKT